MQLMIKINELTETRYRTVHYIDEYGNRERDREEFIGKREVKSLSTPLRMANCVVDMIIYQILISFVGYVSALTVANSQNNLAIDLGLEFSFFITTLLIYPLYYSFFEYTWQRTPGKFITKTIVVNEYGEKPDLGYIILRSVLRMVPFEFISCYGDKYSYGWHDKFSKTWTVPYSELEELKRLQLEQEIENNASPTN